MKSQFGKWPRIGLWLGIFTNKQSGRWRGVPLSSREAAWRAPSFFPQDLSDFPGSGTVRGERLPPPRECHPPCVEPLQSPHWLRAVGGRHPAGLLSRTVRPAPGSEAPSLPPHIPRSPIRGGATAASNARLSWVSGPQWPGRTERAPGRLRAWIS